MANSSLFYPPAAYPPTPDTMRNSSNNMSHAQRYQYEDAPLEAGVNGAAAPRHSQLHQEHGQRESACKLASVSSVHAADGAVCPLLCVCA